MIRKKPCQKTQIKDLQSQNEWLKGMLNDERTRVHLLEKEIEIRKLLPTIDKRTLSSINIANERVTESLAHVIQFLITKLPKQA